MDRKRKPAKALVIATSRKTKGGITSVILLHEQCDFWREFSVRWLETHVDSHFYLKICYALKSYLQYLFILPFYDIVHIHLSGFPSALRKIPFFFLAKLYRKKVIIHFHSCCLQTTIKGRYKQVYRFLFSNAERVIVLSHLWKEWVDQYLHLNDNIVIVYNACHKVRFVDESERENLILYAGGLNKRKGYDDLLTAFATIYHQYPDWKLVFAGSGEIEHGKRKAQDLGLYDQTLFLGWIDGLEKDRWFAKARIFCLPSYAEGFPTALLDACSYGIPFIVTPVGGIPDIVVNEKNGLLFTPGDTASLAIQLKLLIDNRVLRKKLGDEAFNLACTTFNIDETDRIIHEIYHELTDK